MSPRTSSKCLVIRNDMPEFVLNREEGTLFSQILAYVHINKILLIFVYRTPGTILLVLDGTYLLTARRMFVFDFFDLLVRRFDHGTTDFTVHHFDLDAKKALVL